MANTVLIKRSGSSNETPASLEVGEIAINYADGKLFYKNSDNNIVGTKLISGLVGTANQISVTETSGSFAIALQNSVYVNSLFVNNVEIETQGATPGYVLKHDGVKFFPSSLAIDELSDVSLSPLSVGQFLKWNGANWINSTVAITSTVNTIDDIGDVQLSLPSQNQVLLYDGSNWVNSAIAPATGTAYAITVGDGVNSLFNINHNLGTRDVFVVVRDQSSTYEVLNVGWEATSTSTVSLSFDSPPLINSVRVMIYSSLSSGTGTSYVTNIGNGSAATLSINHNLGTRDVLVQFRNALSPYQFFDVSWEAVSINQINAYFDSPPAQNSIRASIYSTVSGSQVAQSVSSLTDTDIVSPSNGEFLKWNGTNWVNANVPQINTLDDVGDVVIGPTPSSGEILKYNGTNWVNSDTVANLTVTGNLTVSGTTTSISTTELLIEDNLIVLNTGSTATPSYNAGIEVDRGNFDNVQIRWNESTDKWQFTNDGLTYRDLGSGGITIADLEPPSPSQGDMWFESDTGSTYVYYDSYWIEIGGSGSGSTTGTDNWVTISVDYVAAVNDAIVADTSGAAFNVTLPPYPAVGSRITIVDGHNSFSARPVTVLRNSQKINGLNEDLALNVSNSFIVIVFIGNPIGWKVV